MTDPGLDPLEQAIWDAFGAAWTALGTIVHRGQALAPAVLEENPSEELTPAVPYVTFSFLWAARSRQGGAYRGDGTIQTEAHVRSGEGPKLAAQLLDRAALCWEAVGEQVSGLHLYASRGQQRHAAETGWYARRMDNRFSVFQDAA